MLPSPSSTSLKPKRKARTRLRPAVPTLRSPVSRVRRPRVAKLNLDGVGIEAQDGAQLVEVIKQNGVFISNLCYIDGLPPYAGCRTCLVEIEGARGLQLACTTRVTDGMAVRSNTAAVLDARQAVLSIINANHSDRCLTCHRRVHCMPGDICLRDDTVTHRCLTCAKNYRCELQTTNEMLHMDNYEPWLGEERTYYETEQPEADRANPFLEFDPQMCIICTRCVRACDEIRHTGAITLAGRGYETRIAFGAGGPIHESNCDFCGACIDVCPTATLLEKPNKWIAKTETWVSTTCSGCSVGCTLSMGVRNGKVVMVKPDRLSPVSWDQICVRGRFGYDSIKARDRLTRHQVRQGDALLQTTFELAVENAATRLGDVIRQHGPQSVGFLVAPWATNEEAYSAQKLARGLIGTENIDSSAGPLANAVEGALTGAFGTHILSADLAQLATAKTIVVIADDLESSHNVAALRVKDAVVNNAARLIVVSSRYGEVADFIAPPPSGAIMPSPQLVHSAEPTGVWLRPSPGGETATVAGLCSVLAEGLRPADAGLIGDVLIPGVSGADIGQAASILMGATGDEGKLAIVFAPSPASPALAAETAKAAANLAVLCRGDQAIDSFYYLPPDVNVNGIRDMGARPGVNGKDLAAMLAGGVRALVAIGDNPAMHVRDQERVEAALSALDCLIVIDSVQTDTAKLAHVAFADLPTNGKDGTYANADRRLLRLSRAESATGDQRDCLEVLNALGTALAAHLGKEFLTPGEDAATVMNEIAAFVDGYAGATYNNLESGVTRVLPAHSATGRIQTVTPASLPTEDGRLLLTTSRSLYTMREAAAIHSEEADKLHREEFLEINPADAAALGIGQNRPVIVRNGSHELTLAAALTDAVAPGSVYLPLYYDGGIVNRLIAAEDALPTVTVRPA
ncbi:MAG: molybdopterin-dependent oxidoreductase [Dehalococcoidia bacterium]|nr:molybdopterin-dependent oxidoreductase [Dehalococcoidia bacterium]